MVVLGGLVTVRRLLDVVTEAIEAVVVVITAEVVVVVAVLVDEVVVNVVTVEVDDDMVAVCTVEDGGSVVVNVVDVLTDVVVVFSPV